MPEEARPEEATPEEKEGKSYEDDEKFRQAVVAIAGVLLSSSAEKIKDVVTPALRESSPDEIDEFIIDVILEAAKQMSNSLKGGPFLLMLTSLIPLYTEKAAAFSVN